VHYARFVPEPLSKLSMVTYIRQFCRGCSTIVSPSDLARRVLRSWGIKERIEIAPSGVDLSLLPKDLPATRQKLIRKHRLPSNTRNLLYVGRISKEKNLPFILNAFKKIKSPAHLLLAGGGPHLKDFKKKRIKNVHFLGEIAYPEVLQYYALGDIFVFASLTETQGLVLVEAKAAGLPVVALFAGGLTTSVRSGIDGYLTPRNQKDYVEHIERLLRDEGLRRHMGQAAREDAHANFSSGVVAKEMESIYNSLI
jgi:glycosyltransferase involved in cell wall biosynthesis